MRLHSTNCRPQVFVEQIIFPPNKPLGEIRIVGAEANHAAGFSSRLISIVKYFAAVGVVPPFRYRGTVYDKIIHRRAVALNYNIKISSKGKIISRLLRIHSYWLPSKTNTISAMKLLLHSKEKRAMHKEPLKNRI